MKFPTKAEEIENELQKCSDNTGDLRLRQFIFILKKVDDDIIVEGIIRLIENVSRHDTQLRDQEFAGRVLEELKPKTQKDLKEILIRILKNWNKSVEQVPFWLRDNYGIDALTETFKQMDLYEEEKDKIKTIKWWLGLKENNS